MSGVYANPDGAWGSAPYRMIIRIHIDDTLKFADKVINKYVVAVIEIEVLRRVVDRVGDFPEVDPFLFKHGTVVVWENDLDEFNNAVLRILHKF